MVYRVTEIFKSIEGEGKRVGTPCTFIRLAGCNLRCRYCDTPYSQNDSDGMGMSIEEIRDAVKKNGLKAVTITGGEPMLQDAIGLARELDWCRCNIETNGSIPLPTKPQNVFYTMDWKCGYSGMTRAMCQDNIKWLEFDDVIKFVVANRSDLDEARDIIRNGVRATAYISPVFGMIEPSEIVSYILENDLDARVQVQLHKVIWDPDKRGV